MSAVVGKPAVKSGGEPVKKEMKPPVLKTSVPSKITPAGEEVAQKPKQTRTKSLTSTVYICLCYYMCAYLENQSLIAINRYEASPVVFTPAPVYEGGILVAEVPCFLM